MASLSQLLSQIIHFFYSVTTQVGIANYGIAIIMFTIAIKVLLFPLTRKQMQSLKKMQEIQPKIQEIQKKHKGNPQKSQQAVMELYKEHGANPFGGCWPLLIQMPILFALFATLKDFFNPAKNPNVNLDHAGFIWINNLGNPDPLIILPVLVAISMFVQQYIQQKNTTVKAKTADEAPNPMAQTQKTMLYVMPLMLGYFSKNFPAGLSLYWVVYNVMATLELLLINRQPAKLKEESSA